jgi:uncharacterized protein (DUF1800 family)
MAGGADSTSSKVLARFGLGPRVEGLSLSGRDTLAALRAEISAPVAQPQGKGLPSVVDALSDLDEFRTEQRKRRDADAAKRSVPADPAMNPAINPAMNAENPMMAPGTPPNRQPAPQPYAQQVFRDEAQARLDLALSTPLGFAERWVWFWSNHFCVAASKGQPLRVLAGNYERTVIRPHAFGRFGEMLRASAGHPAMLIYLDNRQSIGPNSRAGTRRGRGLNENLAREILELHTLGVKGGYTQADVTNLARMLTGWTVIGPNDEDGEIGEFRFNPNRHEPGAQVMLGRNFEDHGIRQAEAALAYVAQHPATARFIATKLVRHFIADEPPPALVQRLAEVFTATKGDLAALAKALLDAPEALEAPATKLRSPQEFVVAALRATGRKGEVGYLLNTLNALGQPLWTPSGPNGFPDSTSAWTNPEGMKVRLEAAATLGRTTPGTQSPSQMLDVVLGPRASAETRQAVARAESRAQGMALLLMSPEFQRR